MVVISMETRRVNHSCLVSAMILTGLMLSGCFMALPNTGDGANGGSPSDGDRPEDRVVIVRFKNFTLDEAVDVEFFATNLPLSNLPDDLFLDIYRFTASVGIAGTGFVEPLVQDRIEFPCTNQLTLGTRGGRFVDNETGEFRGIGQPRWVTEGPLSLCGSVVTFEYHGNGLEFTTKLQITN